MRVNLFQTIRGAWSWFARVSDAGWRDYLEGPLPWLSLTWMRMATASIPLNLMLLPLLAVWDFEPLRWLILSGMALFVLSMLLMVIDLVIHIAELLYLSFSDRC